MADVCRVCHQPREATYHRKHGRRWDVPQHPFYAPLPSVADSPRCWLCKREDEILAGTYTRVDFGGDIGIVLVCDSCSEKADIPPREWIQDHGGYALVIDEGV